MTFIHSSNQKKPKPLPFHPSAFLLAAQLLLLVLYAIFDDFARQHALISAFNVVILVLIVWVVNHSPAIQWLTWCLAVPSLAMALLSAVFPGSNLLVWSSVFNALIYFYAAGSLIAYMLGDERVTTDELFAVGATYTLLAWGFACLYLVCQAWIPGSFINTVSLNAAQTFIEFLFLSFTNLSSTGLSDIVPVSSWGRVIIMLEQFAGVGYMAMVVSRLIGLTLQKQSRMRH